MSFPSLLHHIQTVIIHSNTGTSIRQIRNELFLDLEIAFVRNSSPEFNEKA